MGDEYYRGVWIEVVAKRGCEVYAKSATVGEANKLSEGLWYEKRVGKDFVKYHLSYSTLFCLEKSPTVKYTVCKCPLG